MENEVAEKLKEAKKNQGGYRRIYRKMRLLILVERAKEDE